MPELVSLDELLSHRSALIKAKCESQFEGFPDDRINDGLLDITAMDGVLPVHMLTM